MTEPQLIIKLKELLSKIFPSYNVLTKQNITISSEFDKDELNILETIVERTPVNPSQKPVLQNGENIKSALSEFIKLLKMSKDITQTSSEINTAGIEKKMFISSSLTNSDSGNLNGLNLTADDIDILSSFMSEGAQSLIPFKHIIIIILYLIIGFVAIIGNLLVVQLVIRSRRLHTLTHTLLANLAVADLFMAFLNIPFSAARVIMTEWIFGSFLCQLIPFVQVTSVYVISITMFVIAFDRYQVIMNPLGRRMKSAEGIPIILAIWALSGLLSLPYALHQKVVTVLTVRVVKRCQAEFESIEYRQLLTVGTFFAQYLIPLLFTTLSYVRICKKLGNRSSEFGTSTPRQVDAQSRAKRKTIKMLVITVIFFAVSWAPINFYHLLTHFNVVRHDSTAILICHLIAISSAMYNPGIYCWRNEHFRREAYKWLRCFRTRRSPVVHPGIEVNGMLARADLVLYRRHQSSTMHTSFRSQILPPGLRSPRGLHPESLFLTNSSEEEGMQNIEFSPINPNEVDDVGAEEVAPKESDSESKETSGTERGINLDVNSCIEHQNNAAIAETYLIRPKEMMDNEGDAEVNV